MQTADLHTSLPEQHILHTLYQSTSKLIVKNGVFMERNSPYSGIVIAFSILLFLICVGFNLEAVSK